ncbi:MAG: DUF4352 domain-containing protein [Thermoproteota archaeon]
MNTGTKKRVFATLLAIFLVTFTSILPNAFANSYVLQVTSVVLRDESGNVITSVSRGKFVFAEVTVQNTQTYAYASQPFLLIARLTYGSPPTLEGLGAFKGSLAGGQSMTAAPGFQIPKDGPTGTYTVTILVFSDWPSAGGYPIAAVVTTTITVTP